MEDKIHSVDYVVLIATICLSLFVGIYLAYKQRNSKSTFGYHRASGKLSGIPVALSLLVTFESSISFLGNPAEVYIYGFKYWLANVGWFLGISSLIWISVPLFYPLDITSVFEYLEMRFGSLGLRRFATIVHTISMIIYAGMVTFGTGIALESVTKVPSAIYVVILTVIAVIYTSLGGLKAVVATDVIQGIIMMTTVFAVLIYGTVVVGGVQNVVSLNIPSGRLDLVDFNPNPYVRHTFLTLIVGTTIRSLDMSIRQPAVQRLNSTSSINEAKKVVYIALPGFLIIELLLMIEGLVAFAYFSHKGCDPLASKKISNPNQIMSFIVYDMFGSYRGTTGLFLGALCSASLSTISSLLSSVSALISEDIIRPRWKNINDARLTAISKILVVVVGLVCIGVALLVQEVKGPMSQISTSILGAMSSPLTGLFMMSIFIKMINKKGAIVGTLVGLGFALWLSVGYNFSPDIPQTPWLSPGPIEKCPLQHSELNTTFYQVINFTNNNSNRSEGFTEGSYEIRGLGYLYNISYLYFPLMVMIVSILVGIITSKVTASKDEPKIPSNLILVFWKQILCCLTFKKKEVNQREMFKLCELEDDQKVEAI